MKRTPPKRKSPIRRSAAPNAPKAPRTPIPKKNPARASLALARAFGGEERVVWIQAQPCIACGRGPSTNAHVRSGGASRRADAQWIVPLCPPCHTELHQFGQKTFEAVHGIDLGHWAQVIDARWDAYVCRNTPKEDA